MAATTDNLFEAFFNLSLTGGILFTPVPDAAGEVTDFAFARLNSVAQRVLALPERPAESLLTRYPHALETGIFAFYSEAYTAGEAGPGEFNYQYDGPDSYYRLAAQRVGEQLLVSFTDTREQSRPAGQQALRDSQAHEQQAHSEAEGQNQPLYQVLRQLPADLALFQEPTHVFAFVSAHPQRLYLNRLLQGLPLPELAGQALEQALNHVYQTGEPLFLPEAASWSDATGSGQLDGFITHAHDVIERVLARREHEAHRLQVQSLTQELAAANHALHRSNTQLTRTKADLDTFVYTASHDLKAPITNMEGILNALRDTLPAEVQQAPVVARIMQLFGQTVSRFRLTIHQLTDLARLQQTYNEPAEQVLLAAVVADVLADLAPASTAANAQVHVEVPATLRVSFAPASLRSVVHNLLSNAIKYRSPERPAQVWLSAEAQPGQVVLTVRDNGLGLTAPQQARLFEAFQRLHTHVEGTGVGLYTIKRLIDNAGATITVRSTPYVGSAFTVTFPG